MNKTEIKEAKKQYRNLTKNATQRWLELRVATVETLQKFYGSAVFNRKLNSQLEIQISLMK